MAIDINGDIGDIFKSLFSKKSDGDSANKSGRKSIDPFSKVIVAGVGVFLLVIAYLFIEYFVFILLYLLFINIFIIIQYIIGHLVIYYYNRCLSRR